MGAFQKIAFPQTNRFLLKAADGLLLIDCGNADAERRFLAKLDHMGLTPGSIRYLLLTHHHCRHCGLLPFLLRTNPDLHVIMSEKWAAYLETGRHFQPDGERYAAKTLGHAIGRYGLISEKVSDAFRPYRRRDEDVAGPKIDGYLPDFIGIPGRLLHTTGHTENSLSLIVGEDAFVGDAARNMLNLCGAPYEPILHYDRALCLKNWAKTYPRRGNYPSRRAWTVLLR